MRRGFFFSMSPMSSSPFLFCFLSRSAWALWSSQTMLCFFLAWQDNPAPKLGCFFCSSSSAHVHKFIEAGQAFLLPTHPNHVDQIMLSCKGHFWSFVFSLDTAASFCSTETLWSSPWNGPDTTRVDLWGDRCGSMVEVWCVE